MYTCFRCLEHTIYFFDPHHMNGRIFKFWPPFFFHMFIMTPSIVKIQDPNSLVPRLLWKQTEGVSEVILAFSSSKHFGKIQTRSIYWSSGMTLQMAVNDHR